MRRRPWERLWSLADAQTYLRDEVEGGDPAVPHGQWADSVRDAAVSKGLSANSLLPPVLWIRLCKERGLSLFPAALRSFTRWEFELEAGERDDGGRSPGADAGVRSVPIYLYRTPTNTWSGRRRLTGEDRALTGYRTLDLLLLEETTTPRWPYDLEWRLKIRDRAGTERQAPTMDQLEKKWGVRVAKAVGAAVEKEHRLEDSLLSENDVPGVAYRSDVPIQELIDKLRGHSPAIGKYSDSTLRGALPFFVSSKRGRQARA